MTNPDLIGLSGEERKEEGMASRTDPSSAVYAPLPVRPEMVGKSMTKTTATPYSAEDLEGLADLLDNNIQSGHDIPSCFNGNTLSRLIAQCYRAFFPVDHSLSGRQGSEAYTSAGNAPRDALNPLLSGEETAKLVEHVSAGERLFNALVSSSDVLTGEKWADLDADTRGRFARAANRFESSEIERLRFESQRTDVAMCELLAKARTERDTWRKTAERMVEEPDALAAALARANTAEAEVARLHSEIEELRK